MTTPSRAQTSTGWAELLSARFIARFALLCLGIWLNAADALMTATIMPSVARDIGGYAYYGWSIAGYILGSILAGATAGRFSMKFGIRRAMAISAVIYTLGCLVSALSPEIASFLVGRLLQGIGAGWIVGLCFVAAGTMFPEDQLPRVLTAMSAIWGVATLLGPLIGGVFAEMGLWRAAFWFFAVQGVGFGLAAIFLLNPGRAADDAPGDGAGAPVRQLLVLTSGIALIAAAGLVADVKIAVALAISGFAFLLFFVRIDSRANAPLLPRSSGDLRSAAGSGYALIFALTAASIGYSVYGAAMMQASFGLSPLVAGYVVGSEALGWTAASFVVAGLGPRWHGTFIRFGASCVVAGVAMLAVTMGRGPVALIVLSSAIMGSGFGFSWAFVARRILAGIPDAERAIGASAVPTVQLIGAAAGSAGAGAIANFLGFATGIDATTASGASFWLFASFVPVAAVGWAAAWRLGKPAS